MGRDTSAQSDADIHAMLAERARRFVTDAPTSAAEALNGSGPYIL